MKFLKAWTVDDLVARFHDGQFDHARIADELVGIVLQRTNRVKRQRNAERVLGYVPEFTWKPESNLSRLRLYIDRRYRGIACPIFMGSKQERWLREAFAVECAKAQNEANAAAVFTTEQILEHDETLGSCLQPLSDDDAELARIEKSQKMMTRSAGVARQDAERDTAAERLSIIPAVLPHEAQGATSDAVQIDAGEALKAFHKVSVRKGAK